MMLSALSDLCTLHVNIHTPDFTVWICHFHRKDFNTLSSLQTAAEDLINGLEDYIAESFVRTTSVTHGLSATVHLMYWAVS